MAVEGTLLGLGWFLSLGVVLARLGLLGRPGLVAPSLVLAGAGWARALPVVRRWPRPRFSWPGAGLAALVGLAAFLRRDAFYFLFQTADFGEYVNRANILAAGGPFHDWFLHLFSVALGLSNVALGPAGTVDILPFLGLVVVAGIAALGQRLGFAPVVVAGVLAVLALEPVAVWFSRFPASETLYAALMVAFVLFAVLAVRRGRPLDVAAPAAFAGLMMVTRANAVLLGPVLVLALAVGAVVLGRPALRSFAAVVAASLLALYAGFVYDARNSAAYFVDYQLEAFTPGRLFPLIDTLGRPVEAVLGALALALAVAALVAGALGLNRLAGPGSRRRWAGPVRRALLPGVAVTMAVAVPVAFRALGLVDALPRYGWLFLAVVAVGAFALVATVARPAEEAGRVVAGVLAVVVGGAFVLLFARRLPEAHDAPYHLYWDRYLFSEVFPAMAVAALWGAAAVVAGVRRLARGRPATALVAMAGVAVLVGAGTQVGQRLALQRQEVLFDGAYRQLQDLDELAGPDDLPVVYSGLDPAELPDGWLHTNTFRVFALPLQQSFGRQVLNIGGVEPFAADPRPTEAEVAELMRRRGVDEAVLVMASPPPPAGGGVSLVSRSRAGLEHRWLGALSVQIPLLPRRLDPADETWRQLTMDLDVWRVTLASSGAGG